MKETQIIPFFDNKNFQQEFESILTFLSETCDVTNVFISQISFDEHSIIANLEVNLTNTIKENEEELFLYINTVIEQNKNSILSDKKIANGFTLKTSKSFSYNFFTGIPLLNSKNLVIGTLCFMDEKSKTFSPLQLKIAKNSAQQIQSILELKEQNNDLQKLVIHKKNQLQLYFENSKNISFELNLEGIFTYISSNWLVLLGYESNEVEGRSFVNFIHIEDIKKYFSFINDDIKTKKSEVENEFRILHKKGHYLWFTSFGKLLIKKERTTYVGTAREITETVEVRNSVLYQKEFYEKILDRIPTDVAVYDDGHRYVYLNPFAIKNEKLRKYIIGKDDFQYAKHVGKENLIAKERRTKFLKAIETKTLIEWEESLKTDNQITYHNRKFNPVFREDGTFEMMVGFGVDITESKKNQEEILESKQLTSGIIQNVATGILVQGSQLEILENNKAACYMLGLSESQLTGKTPYDEGWKTFQLDGSDFLDEELPVPQAIKKLTPIKNIVMGIYRPLTKDVIWLLVDAIPVLNDLKELLYVVCSFNDITEIKNTEEELRISNERLAYSREASSDAIWDWNMITNEIFIGTSFSFLFGHNFETNIITSLEFKNFIHPEDRESYFDSIKMADFNKWDKWTNEYRYLKSDGSFAYVNDRAILIRNPKGEVIRMIGAMQDITKKKKLEDELRQSEEQFKGAFELSSIGMGLMNLDGNWKEVNDKLCDILGYSKDEFKSLSIKDITFGKDLNDELLLMKKLISGEIHNFNIEKRYVHKNKSLVWAFLSVALVRNNKGEAINFVSQIIDFSERKKVEKENKLLVEENNKNKTIQLNEAKNLYRLLADNTVNLVCLHSLDGTLKYVSPSVKNLLGYEPEFLIGKSPKHFMNNEDFEGFEHGLSEFLNKEKKESQEFQFKNSRDEYIWLEVSSTIIEENGIATGFQSNGRDITHQKEAKKIIEQALLKEKDLNELRTNLVSTISHEFRTPMTTIRTSAELIEMYLEGQKFETKKRIDKQLGTITGEIDRITELMNAVLTISKDDAGKTNFHPITFDLKKLCLDVIETSFDNQKDGRKVQTLFQGIEFNVFADRNLMEYSLFNLFNNAFKYSENSGDIILHITSNLTKINLEIIDFGIGIPKEDQHKLFNTFFRASNTNGIQGTGLGLYIVKTFTEKNFGKIRLESQLNKGTKVTLEFPLKKQ
jgi:PAS domain S-box-containing protein